MKDYEFFEHTADIGIRVKGNDLKELFANAGLAVFRLLAEQKITKGTKYSKLSIKQKAADLDELFINWLNELLSLSSARGLIFEKFSIQKISHSSLEAVVTGRGVENYQVNTEIKAATYHELKIKKKILNRWPMKSRRLRINFRF